MKKLFSLTLLAAFALSSHAAGAPDTLGKIKASKTITLAYAQNATPFSFDDTRAFKPAGYSISLCEGDVAQIQRQLGLDGRGEGGGAGCLRLRGPVAGPGARGILARRVCASRGGPLRCR